MKVQATKPNTPRRWRPLSQAQLNAIDLLLAGKNDTEVASDPRVNTVRQTIWTWKSRSPCLWPNSSNGAPACGRRPTSACAACWARRLRILPQSIEAGNVADSWNLLKALGCLVMAPAMPSLARISSTPYASGRSPSASGV